MNKTEVKLNYGAVRNNAYKGFTRQP